MDCRAYGHEWLFDWVPARSPLALRWLTCRTEDIPQLVADTMMAHMIRTWSKDQQG